MRRALPMRRAGQSRSGPRDRTARKEQPCGFGRTIRRTAAPGDGTFAGAQTSPARPLSRFAPAPPTGEQPILWRYIVLSQIYESGMLPDGERFDVHGFPPPTPVAK